MSSNSVPQDSSSPVPQKKSLWELADEFISSVPPEEFAKLPKDGSIQHDHYIYGWPKRTQ